MTDIPVRTSLQRAPRNPLSPEQVKHMAQRAYHEHGVVVFVLKDIPNDFDRQYVTNLANKQFGKPMKKNGGSR